TPLLPERLTTLTGGLTGMGDELGDVKADTAGTDHHDLLTDRLALQDGVQIVDHLGVVDALNGRGAWCDTGGQNDFVKAALGQFLSRHAGIQAQIDTRGFDLLFEVAQGFKELLFARYALG